MAVSGHNGNNETLVGMSSSISLSFYDTSSNLIDVSPSLSSINITIPRDQLIPTLPVYSFVYVNATGFELKIEDYLLLNAFNLTSNNASIHIELVPFNISIGYLIVLKLGFVPIVNSSYADYTSFRVFCPSISIIFIQ